MTENDKIALLNDINSTARMLDYFRKERTKISEKLLQLENIEEIANTIELQLKICTVFNTLHDLIHCYIEEADQKGYEVVWKDFEAVELSRKKDEN